MAGDRSQPSQTAEQTEERTVSSDRFDDVVQSVDGLKQSVDELDTGSSILFDESPIQRGGGIGDVPNIGRSPGLPDPSTSPPLGIDPKPSNRELKRKLNAQGRRLREVEERLDDVVDALREGLRENAQEHVGTDDLGEANRRYEVLHSWRYDDG